jgi:predicted Zn finger-like uncharacterized protein
MYTQCSNCATLFRVTSRHLRQAHGLVRCCLCQEVFDALSSLAEVLPHGIDGHRLTGFPASAGPAAGPGSPAVAAPASEYAASAIGPSGPDGVELPDADGVAVEETNASAGSRFGTAGWSAALLVLLAVLVMQYAYVMREELARYPRLRPLIEGLCLAAGCELPLLRDVSRIHILHKHIGVHPTRAGALLVEAVIANDAGFRQPYPQIGFSFLDPGGDVRLSRWFSPQAYLTDSRAPADIMNGMVPREPVSVRLELPGVGPAAADNFAIDFR